MTGFYITGRQRSVPRRGDVTEFTHGLVAAMPTGKSNGFAADFAFPNRAHAVSRETKSMKVPVGSSAAIVPIPWFLPWMNSVHEQAGFAKVALLLRLAPLQKVTYRRR
jgi:hypothetical protein